MRKSSSLLGDSKPRIAELVRESGFYWVWNTCLLRARLILHPWAGLPQLTRLECSLKTNYSFTCLCVSISSFRHLSILRSVLMNGEERRQCCGTPFPCDASSLHFIGTVVFFQTWTERCTAVLPHLPPICWPDGHALRAGSGLPCSWKFTRSLLHTGWQIPKEAEQEVQGMDGETEG